MPPKKRKLKDDKKKDEDMSDSVKKTSGKRGRPKKQVKQTFPVKDRKRKRDKDEEVEEEDVDEEIEEEEVDDYEYIKKIFSNAKSLSELTNKQKELIKKYSSERDILIIISELYKSRKEELEEEKKQKEATAFPDIIKTKENLYKWFKSINNYELNGINKISYKAINNYVLNNLGNFYGKFDLFNKLYNHVSTKYSSDNENNILINMCLMLDSVHDFIGERTELTSDDREIMIKTIFQIDDNDSDIYDSLIKLKAGDFENELLLWLLTSKYNNYNVVSKALFGDMISIGEQTKKDNLSSLFTIDAFNKSFEVYRNTLYYMATEIDTKKDKIKLISEIDKNVDKFLFRINIIDKLNELITILKRTDKYSPKNVKTSDLPETYKYVIHLLRNYIYYYKFDDINLIDEKNDSDKMTNVKTFFNKYENNFIIKGVSYYIDIDKLKSSLKKILILPDINNNDDLKRIILAWLEMITPMKNDLNHNPIINLYDKEIPKYESAKETSETLIEDAIIKANNKLVSDVISKSKEYIEFVAIPPQLFDANESTGGENMKILNIKYKINILEQKDELKFNLLQDTCTLKYDKKENKNYIFTVDNINYPIETIIIKDGFIASGYKTGWDISTEKYAYKKDKRILECRSCPGVTELFELYKKFTEEYNYKNEDVLNNIFQIKRAGDYSQIFFCKLYNNTNDNTIYFLSNDRMSSSFCLLLDVPFVAPIYSGAIGSETFGVYYNPYKDRKKLYIENKTKEDNKNITNSLISKFENIKERCNQISNYDKEFKCNIEDIDKQIGILIKLKNSKNDYEIVSKLLEAQEIYKGKKYIINEKFDALYASQILQSMKTQTDIIQIPDKLFTNSQDKVTYKLHYKYLTKLYKYIKSLYILDPNSLELEKYIILYNKIYYAILYFLENEYDGDIGMERLFSAIEEEEDLELLEDDDEYMQQESQNLFESNTSTKIKYIYNPLTKDISLKKYKHYNTVMFYNEKGYLLVQDFNPSAVIKINSIQKAKEQTYPDGTKITFKLN